MKPPAPDTALRLTRVFNASVERVYEVWTDLEHAKEWWGPEGCETLELSVDARVGGQYVWRLRTPDGLEMKAFGEYREVIPRERLVYTWAWADDPEWENHESIVKVEFIAKDEKTTELRLTHENLPSRDSRENHEGGWTSALARFSRLVGS
jgi:uncharacterized protein YndB with AHSA1/START domain